MAQGYLYIACGEKYIRQTIVSAESLRRVDGAADITLITDHPIENKCFNRVILRQMHYSFLDKVRYVYEFSPYERTFYLDSDTYFYGNCSKLFSLLDYFDICMTPAPGGGDLIVKEGSVTPFEPYNCGMFVFRKNARTEKLFMRWLQIYNERLNKGYCSADVGSGELDQTSFGMALMHSECRPYILPYNYNARLPFFLNLKGEVMLVHGWGVDYEEIRKRINITAAQRCWDPFRMRCVYGKRNIFIRSLGKLYRKFLKATQK